MSLIRCLGLALARGLVSTHIKVKIFERDQSQTSRSQGYQLGLNGDGIKVLKAINMPNLDQLLTKNAQNSFVVLDRQCKVLLTVGGKSKTGAQDMAIVNRWNLRDSLAKDLDIEWNKKFVRYEEFPDKVVAHFEDGTSYTADLLIGADGAKSRVRKQRCPTLSYDDVGVVNIAGFFPRTDNILKTLQPYFADSLSRIMGPNGYTMLYVPFIGEEDKECLVWAFSYPKPAEEVPTEPETMKNYLLDIAKSLQVPEFIEAIEVTPPENLLKPRYMKSINTSDKDPFKGTTRVTLIGDAAHAMTTHRGIGILLSKACIYLYFQEEILPC
jgi:2-polyprenyl-6-methoxyphenol hydroxylase-like FAD-dependent oxidoreductase